MLQSRLLMVSVLFLAVFILIGCPPPIPPGAAFTYSPMSGEAPLEITFEGASDAGSEAVTARLWEFGDPNGTTSGEESPSFTYADPGTYTVTLTVTTSAGSDTATATVTVSAPPVPPEAAFTHAPMSGEAPLEISFEDTSDAGSEDITAWLWEFGDLDGSTSDQQNSSFTYTLPDTYTVNLTVTTSAGSSTATAQITVDPGAGSQGESCAEGSLVGQAPPLPEEMAFIVWSDESVNNVMYDNFSGLSASVGGVQWWGFNTTGDGTACTRDPDTYVIRFFADGAEPGQLISEYIVTPSKADTGLEYEGLSLARFSTALEPPLAVTSGWISIVGTGGNVCKTRMISSADGDNQSIAENLGTLESFIVGHDLAFCLTEGAPGK